MTRPSARTPSCDASIYIRTSIGIILRKEKAFDKPLALGPTDEPIHYTYGTVLAHRSGTMAPFPSSSS
jgi:hypothetical protein